MGYKDEKRWGANGEASSPLAPHVDPVGAAGVLGSATQEITGPAAGEQMQNTRVRDGLRAEMKRRQAESLREWFARELNEAGGVLCYNITHERCSFWGVVGAANCILSTSTENEGELVASNTSGLSNEVLTGPDLTHWFANPSRWFVDLTPLTVTDTRPERSTFKPG